MKYNIQNNCINISSENQIVFWANNNNTDNIIEIQPQMWPPIMTYSENIINNGNHSLLNYQWCGPMMLIVKEFAKRVNAK